MSGSWDEPLSATGMREAARAAERIAATLRPSVVFASPLLRARQTAKAIQTRWPVEVRVEAGLAEISCGDVDGIPIREVRERYSTEWERNMQQTDPDFRWPGGESYREFRERVLRTLCAIAELAAGERVLVVTHAGVISQVMGVIHGRSAAVWSDFRPRNCSLTELIWSAQSPSLVSFDSLEQPDSAPAA